MYAYQINWSLLYDAWNYSKYWGTLFDTQKTTKKIQPLLGELIEWFDSLEWQCDGKCL